MTQTHIAASYDGARKIDLASSRPPVKGKSIIEQLRTDRPDANRLLNSKEVRKLLRISHTTMHVWLVAGILPQPIAIGSKFRAWRYRDILAWIEKHLSVAERVTAEKIAAPAVVAANAASGGGRT